MELNKCYNIDNVQGLARFVEDNSIDLTITSPPYDNLRKYQGFSFDIDNLIKQLFRVTKNGGVVVWVCQDACIDGGETLTSFKTAIKFVENGFKLYDTMIWEKPSPQAPTEGRYYDVFEYMFVFSKGKPKTLNLLNDRKNKSAGNVSRKETRSCKEDRKLKDEYRTVKEYGRRFNVWMISRGKNQTEHPAVFPEKLATDHILSWSNEGDIVLDPFAGSGTTLSMAKQNGRKYICFEISEKYCNIIEKRLEVQLQRTIFAS